MLFLDTFVLHEMFFNYIVYWSFAEISLKYKCVEI